MLDIYPSQSIHGRWGLGGGGWLSVVDRRRDRWVEWEGGTWVLTSKLIVFVISCVWDCSSVRKGRRKKKTGRGVGR